MDSPFKREFALSLSQPCMCTFVELLFPSSRIASSCIPCKPHYDRSLSHIPVDDQNLTTMACDDDFPRDKRISPNPDLSTSLHDALQTAKDLDKMIAETINNEFKFTLARPCSLVFF